MSPTHVQQARSQPRAGGPSASAAFIGTGSDVVQGATRDGMPRFLQGFGRSGALAMGASGDAAEREAEAFERAVLGRECAPHESGQAAMGMRGEVSRSTPPAEQGSVDTDAGEPLHPALRPRLERSIGAGLGGVRVHAGADAGHAASALRARAFAQGEHIWLGRGSRADDLSLMAHEVAHVVQQRGGDHDRAAVGVRLSADAPVIRRWGEGESSTEVVEPGSSFTDPDAVDVEGLSNAGLIEETLRVADWLAGAPPETSEESEAYRRLGERLTQERELRAAAGHEWLADAARATPTELYQLVPGVEGLTTIVSIDPGVALEARRETPAGPVMTPLQYREYLSEHGIPEVDEETFRDLAAQALPLTAFSTPLPPEMPIPYGTAAEGWVARLYYPEAVTLPRAYPAFDLVSGGEHGFELTAERASSGPMRGSTITVVNQTVEGGEWVSVKMIADPVSATPGHIDDVVADALRDMANKSGAIRDPHAIDTGTFWRMGRASPERAVLHILVPAEAAGEVPALQAAADSLLAATDYGPGGLPPEVEVRVTAWNPRPPGSTAAGPPLPARPK